MLTERLTVTRHFGRIGVSMFVVEILDVPITELVKALNRIGADLLTRTVKAKTILSVAKNSYVYYPNIRISLFRCFLHQREEGMCEYHGT